MQCDCFWKDSEEIRAEPELGGLGPGLTGEHTLYSFVVARNDKRSVLTHQLPATTAACHNLNAIRAAWVVSRVCFRGATSSDLVVLVIDGCRWVLKKRFRQLYTFDQVSQLCIRRCSIMCPTGVLFVPFGARSLSDAWDRAGRC